MQLRAWLREKKMTDAEFARVSGIGFRQIVYRYALGKSFPSPENLLRIRQATDGQVTADDFVDQHASASALSVTPTDRTPAQAAA